DSVSREGRYYPLLEQYRRHGPALLDDSLCLFEQLAPSQVLPGQTFSLRLFAYDRRDRRKDLPVEHVGDDVGPAEPFLLCRVRELPSRSYHHRVADGPRPHVERPPEDTGEEHAVVDLIGEVGPTRRHYGCTGL